MIKKLEKLTIVIILMGMFFNSGLMANAEDMDNAQFKEDEIREVIPSDQEGVPLEEELKEEVLPIEITEKEEEIIEENIIEEEIHEKVIEEEVKPVKKDEAVEKPPVKETEVKVDDKDELAEYVPNVLGQPLIPIPFSMFRTMGTRSGLTDTIAVNKTAARCPGCRTFEVTLDITGTPQEAPVDVVLVIDRSGSMGFTASTNPTRTRLYYAKEAAVNFAGRVLGPNGIPGSRVSVVSFSGPTSTNGYGNQNQASTDLNLSTNLTTVTNTINNISAGGGTNTEAGFKQGQAVIQGATSNQNPNSNKVVVMLTDGLPTASNGNIYADTTNINHVHIQRAIAAGKNIFQNNIADVFTIGLTTGMNATEKALADNILTQAQNKGYYPAPDATDLDAIFDAISQSLGYAATNASVVDKIGNKFDFVPGSLSTTDGTASETSGTITWNPGTIVSSAQLKYKVVAKASFAGGLADTNDYATLTYKDIFGAAGKTKTFPIPKVNVPTLIEVVLTNTTITRGQTINLGSGTNPLGENYMGPVTGGDNDGTIFTYEWRVVGNSTVISTAKNPSVKPSVDTNYEVRITDSNGCIAIGLMTVFVTEPTVNITANKVWVGGPTVKPTIEFQLYQNGIAYGPTVNLLNGVISKTWNDLPKLDANADEFEYTVKEVGVPENYTKVEEGLTVTNTYVSPKIDITATKVWIDGPEDKPDIQFELYRNNIKIAGPVTLVNGVTTYTWPSLDKTDSNGVDYIYTVKEIGSLGTYTKEEIGLTVKNTYVSPKIEITANKVWEGGPDDKPTIEFQLYRGSDPHRAPIELASGTTSYTWTDLDKTDSNGIDYIYTVKETGTPENYTKLEEGLTVTNTYVSPKIEKTANKVWEGGPDVKPTIEFQLYRGSDPHRAPIELASGTTSYTWTELDKTDSNGVDYIYTVKETGTPENYTKLEEGLTVTNTYVSPKTKLVVNKAWIDAPTVRPTIELQLYQNGIAHRDSVELANGVTSHTWNNLDLTNNEGVNYIYTVAEIKVTSDTEVLEGEDISLGYDVTYSEIIEDNMTITNKYKLGSLNIIKKDKDNNVLEGAEFKLTTDVEGNNIIYDDITTGANGLATASGLLRGTYYLHETKAPDGHRLLTSPIEVTIEVRNLVVEIEVLNSENGYELPPTGGMGTALYYMAGSILMINAFVFSRRKKRL